MENKRQADKKENEKTTTGHKPPPPKVDVITTGTEVTDEITELSDARKEGEKCKRGDASPSPISTEKKIKAKLNPDDKSGSDSENSMSETNVSWSDYDPVMADPLLTET